MYPGDGSSDHYLLAVRCVSLSISPGTVFSSGTWSFSSLLTRSGLTASSAPKNERRYLKLSQSEPFPVNKRPNSLKFDVTFISEMFDDQKDIAPSQVAKIRKHEGMDSKIGLNILYSSSLTGGKDVLIAATTFSEREMVLAASNTGEFLSEMHAGHCPGARAYIRILPWLSPLLDHSLLTVTAPTSIILTNPATQHYVFYHEKDSLHPYLDACEQTWEPKFSALVPKLFLENFAEALERSIIAWHHRNELERLRQGRFLSESEAHTNGWHVVDVAVKAARFSRRVLARGSGTAAAGNGITVGLTGSNGNGPTVIYNLQFPTGSEFAGSAGLEFAPLLSDDIVTPNRIASVDSQGRRSKRASNFPLLGNAEKVVHRPFNDQAPHSCIEVSIADSSAPFLRPMGRTNTEYFSTFPVYGSNLHSTLMRKANTAAVALDDTVEIELEDVQLSFCSYETPNRDFMPRPNAPLLDDDQLAGDERCSLTACSGQVAHFRKFVPSLNSRLRFDLCMESATGALRRVRSADYQLCSASNGSTWIAMKSIESIDAEQHIAHEGGVGSGDAGMEGWQWAEVELLVAVTVRSPTHSVDSSAPHAMSEACYYDRGMDGSHSIPPEIRTSAHPSYRRVIADCYEWLWMLGFSGQDPLLLENVRRKSMLHLKLPTTRASTVSDHIPDDDNPDRLRNAQMPDSDDEIQRETTSLGRLSDVQAVLLELEQSSAALHLDDVAIANENSETEQLGEKSDSFVDPLQCRPRVDCPYPSEWILDHIHSLQALVHEVRVMQFSLKADHFFRPSTAKKDRESQALPINLNYQLMGVRKHSPIGKGQLHEHELIFSVTVGAITTHLLGHKGGGLLHHLTLLSSRKIAVQQEMDKVVSKLSTSSGQLFRTDEKSGAFATLQSLGEVVREFEAHCVNVARRKLYALSQALSIAVAAALLQINLLVHGTIPAISAQRWLQNGMLLVFEGLLSVTGSERSMLEDTVSAVQTLKSFQLRLKGLPNQDAEQSIKIRGREITIFLPEKVTECFPNLIQSTIHGDGAVIKLWTVLFTQGIDMQQTMVATFGEKKGKRALTCMDLQNQVNSSGLHDINHYCCRSQPLMRGSVLHSESSPSALARTTIHPLVQHLQETLQSGNIKNVKLLAEIERLCLLLGGVRITFCKSGKDRTGMAVTLEQSRQLGERFGSGLSIERVLRDANLMRQYGTRLKVVEKNIGKPVYAFNMLQVQFLPPTFRPPSQVCEDMLKKDNS